MFVNGASLGFATTKFTEIFPNFWNRPKINTRSIVLLACIAKPMQINYISGVILALTNNSSLHFSPFNNLQTLYNLLLFFLKSSEIYSSQLIFSLQSF